MKKDHNVFLDLGFSPAEAKNLKLRSNFMNVLIAEVRRRRLTRKAAGKFLGVTTKRATELMTGRIDLLPIDALFEMLHNAGIRVDVRIKRPAA